MTTEQLKHLRLLKAHLENLLAGAKERTPGEWRIEHGNDLIYRKDWIIAGAFDNEYVTTDCPIIPDEERRANATFIASCAGNAEAGWKSTLAAIEFILMVCDFHSTSPPAGVVQRTELETVETIANRILAEWPLESLKP